MSDASIHSPVVQHEFLITREYWRFVEFCDACRRHRYIGLCHGAPGVGKTLSARYYTQADLMEPPPAHTLHASPFAAFGAPQTLFYTPPVSNSPRQVQGDLTRLRNMRTVLGSRLPLPAATAHIQPDSTELIVVDEAERLRVPSLEQLRDVYDRKAIGLILIGMPGIEKRMARYPQLYSRVGFVHIFQPLGVDEIDAVLGRRWSQLGIAHDSPAAAEAKAAIKRMTNGNFRLIQRLFEQIGRILALNTLDTITPAVVEAARERLIIGTN
jgi:DNA transposition AAA+ family ATPase